MTAAEALQKINRMIEDGALRRYGNTQERAELDRLYSVAFAGDRPAGVNAWGCPLVVSADPRPPIPTPSSKALETLQLRDKAPYEAFLRASEGITELQGDMNSDYHHPERPGCAAARQDVQVYTEIVTDYSANNR